LRTPQQSETGVYPVSAPTFGDILSPASLPVGRMTVTADVSLKNASADGNGVRVKGKAFPSTHRDDAKLILLGQQTGDGSKKMRKGNKAKFNVRFPLDPGDYKLSVKYADPGRVKAATSNAEKVTVP